MITFPKIEFPVLEYFSFLLKIAFLEIVHVERFLKVCDLGRADNSAKQVNCA